MHHVLDHFGQAAAVLLLLYLLIVLIVFAAVAGGLAWGLRWVNGKTEWAFGKANTYTALGPKYVHKGSDYVAKPLIAAGGLSATVSGTARAIQHRIKEIRVARSTQPMAARPLPIAAPVEESVPEPVRQP